MKEKAMPQPHHLNTTKHNKQHKKNTNKQSEFRYWQRKKPTSHLEAKVKNVKFIGELVKFKVRMY